MIKKIREILTFVFKLFNNIIFPNVLWNIILAGIGKYTFLVKLENTYYEV